MNKQYFRPAPWTITETTHDPALNGFHETIFFLGNGYMGVRGTPEEGLQQGVWSARGTYMPLVYDLVPQGGGFLGSVLFNECTVMITGIDIVPMKVHVAGEPVGGGSGRYEEYERTLDMRQATVRRRFVWVDRHGRQTRVDAVRFVSKDNEHLAVFRMQIEALNYDGPIEVDAQLDAADCRLLEPGKMGVVGSDGAYWSGGTLKTQIVEAAAMRLRLQGPDGKTAPMKSAFRREARTVSRQVRFHARKGQKWTVEKFVAVCTSRDRETGEPWGRAQRHATQAWKRGFDTLLAAHAAGWEELWNHWDIQIEGDASAQQSIRYSILNMHMNYSGRDERVNIGAKGISGPGYAGLIFWDTEIYLMPYYLYSETEKARQLLAFRHATLEPAKERAAAFGNRGAQFPASTIDGKERGGNWEYSQTEIHFTADVAYAIWHYMEVTQDESFLCDYGAELLAEIARFWASRLYYNPRRRAYVLNCITGPNEYKVMVNNNAFTNAMVQFALRYAAEIWRHMRRKHPEVAATLQRRLKLTEAECREWQRIASRIYLPREERLGIIPENDSFLDMEPVDVRAIPDAMRPLHHKWPWINLMRAQVIKQADVLLLMYLLHDRFTLEEKKRNYDFYEPKTIHDSSLSPCVHSILASEIGYVREAERFYEHTGRLDLNDVNGNTHEGVHIACMAGTWMAIVNGVAGMRVGQNRLRFAPRLPRRWQSLRFAIQYRGRRLSVVMRPKETEFRLEEGAPLTIWVDGQAVALEKGVPQVMAARRGPQQHGKA